MSGERTEERTRIVKCRHCGGYEYWGAMRWLNGHCECRDCYKHHIEEIEHRPYKYTDLDGLRPTEKEYLDQEDLYCAGCRGFNPWRSSSGLCKTCEHAHEDRELNLCDTCDNCFATCENGEEGIDFCFGTGKGFDNVYRCKSYRTSDLNKLKRFVLDEMKKHTVGESVILQPVLNKIYELRKPGGNQDGSIH